MASIVSIKVTPTELRTAASKIREQLEDYTTQYTKLFSHVDDMAAAWQGKDNTAFTTQINATLENFQSMKSLLEEYATFLEKSAQTYEDTQTQLTTAAKQLSI